MTKIKKRIGIFLIACVILVNAVLTQAVVNAETPILDGLFEINRDDPVSTEYNDDTTVRNLHVEEKDITGNTKHYLSWNNADGYSTENIKVEVYAQIYLKYINTENMKMNSDELENAEWEEVSLPVTRCCQADASLEKAVVNFTDLWNALESIPDADFEYYCNNKQTSDLIDWFDSVLFKTENSVLNNSDVTRLAKTRYALTNGITANYIKYSRVKYFVRYVYGNNPTVLDGESRCFYKEVAYNKADDRELFTRNFFNDEGTRYCAFLRRDSGYTFLFEGKEIDEYTDGRYMERKCGVLHRLVLNGNDDCGTSSFREVHTYDGLVFIDEESANSYMKTGEYSLAGLMGWKQQYYKCGKVVENDMELNNDNLYDAPDSPQASPVYPVIVDEGDTGEEDMHTDIVYWLKKIYKRLGAILTALFVEDVVNMVDSFMDNTFEELNDSMQNVTNTAESRFPFSVIYLFGTVLAVFIAEPEIPKLEFDYKIPALGVDVPIKWDLVFIDGKLQLLRNIEVIFFVLCLANYTFDMVQFVKNGGIASD